jgi:hypothetical protein
MAKITIVNAAPLPKVSITFDADTVAGLVGNGVVVKVCGVTKGKGVVCGITPEVIIPAAGETRADMGVGVSVSMGV